ELTDRRAPLCRLPLPGGGDQPGGVAVFPLPPQPAHGRGDAGRARHLRQSRDRAAVGAPVRPGVRRPDSATTADARRQVAPRRGRHQDRRGEALALARGRPGRDGARRAGAEAARQAGRQAPAAQAAEAAMPGAARDGHRQAPELRGGQAGSDARGRAPPAQGLEQPGGELAPADATTRAADEALQAAAASTAVPFRPRPSQQPLPPPPRPPLRQRVPRCDGAGVRDVGRHQRGCCRGL
ncbi:MAG: Mobile element protein, partial [uncultured Acetobacteraceae bacterium]